MLLTLGSETEDTRKRILSVGYQLIKQRGYNAFSYADIADKLGIRKASIHYHFPAKSDLARSVVEQYRTGSRMVQARVRQDYRNSIEQLARYMELVGIEMDGQPRMCICGLLAAELPTLPEEVRAEVQGFYIDQETWLQEVLEEGIVRGELHVQGSVFHTAKLLLATVEGAMLTSRIYDDVKHYRSITQQLLGLVRICV